MSNAKDIRRQRAEERARSKAKNDAVLAERERCAQICEVYAQGALDRGLLIHPQIANQIASLIRKEPA
jgi:hypothetical protein